MFSEALLSALLWQLGSCNFSGQAARAFEVRFDWMLMLSPAVSPSVLSTCMYTLGHRRGKMHVFGVGLRSSVSEGGASRTGLGCVGCRLEPQLSESRVPGA